MSVARAGDSGTTALGPTPSFAKTISTGIKLYLDPPVGDHGAEAWLLLRFSGTEPLIRIYCEASSPELVQELLEDAVAFVHGEGPAGAIRS